MNLPILISLTFTCALAGCARTGALQIQSLDNNHRFAQPFTQAYSSQSDDGAYDIVMVQEPQTGQSEPGAVLKPVEGMPMRQIVHTRVLWKPLRFGRGDEVTTAANATIDWFVLSEDAQLRMNMLHYQGSGLVTVAGSSSSPRISIRNAAMKPLAAVGDLEDPVGQSKVSGNILAHRDPRRVQIILEELKSAVAAAEAPPVAAAASQ